MKYARMKEAKATLAHCFLKIAVKRRWRKLILSKKNEIRNAKKTIKKFYRRRYNSFKLLAEIDNRIITKKRKVE
jgi:hypothetical protein